MTPIAPGVLAGLKDFQRATVEYVFDRLYADNASGRFLVADEVGLGKTLIAKGVIAKAIDHLRKKKIPRIDVVYICSNGDIARQNINRLKVGDENHMPLASRLTLMAAQTKRLNETSSGLNFISFTPATSFDLKSGLGRMDERVLLYWMLREAWGLGSARAPMNVLQGGAGADRFRAAVDAFDPSTIADALVGFKAALAKQPGREAALRAQLDTLCESFARVTKQPVSSPERNAFVGELRALLAASCVNALEPDLIILDEFQRFSHLLDGDDDASRLARELFDFKDVRVLMLSATPYKMYTTADDGAAEDHYADFVRTLRFLERHQQIAGFEKDIAVYREALLAVADAGSAAGQSTLTTARKQLERRLRQVMVRTERLASTPDRNGMLEEKTSANMKVQPGDFAQFLTTQQVARDVAGDDTLELWKSAPFVLNFADDGYTLGRKLAASLETAEGRAQLARRLRTAPDSVISAERTEAYEPVEVGNGRARALIADVVERGAWRLLWVPPSLPYYRLEASFGDPELARFSKRLVFSSWRMVPRAVASLLSYEVERRMLEGDGEARNTPAWRKTRRGLLRFSSSGGRLTGMPVLALMYPSLYLARICDPAALLRERAAEHGAVSGQASLSQIALDDVLAIARDKITVGLRRLGTAPSDGPVDERWYWAAPLLLDRALESVATRAWFTQPNLALAWTEAEEAGPADADDDEDGVSATSPRNDEADSWSRHVEQACAIAASGSGTSIGEGAEPLGRMPDDLVEVLAELAVAGPAVATFRALDRVVGGESQLKEATRIVLRNGAGQVAWSFRTLFNQVEVTSMLRGGARGATELPYWRQALRYCAEGCLPAVLDEYVHVLRDHLGITTGSVADRVHEIAREIGDALQLRTAQVGYTDLKLSDAGRTVHASTKTLRTHFALRLADGKSDDGSPATRADSVRKAFNSPFWPFVLVTTSVGQEGLDFHTYCHAVTHWNLPSNPVDLEQREGRVHRYKGHAVRKNLGQVHGWAALQSEESDLWEAMFRAARAEAAAHGESEIVPFWVYPTEGGARIERHILSLPLSREHGQAAMLRTSLAVYRMVFGQPRQDDLVRYLTDRVPAAELERIMADARIQLAPGASD